MSVQKIFTQLYLKYQSKRMDAIFWRVIFCFLCYQHLWIWSLLLNQWWRVPRALQVFKEHIPDRKIHINNEMLGYCVNIMCNVFLTSLLLALIRSGRISRVLINGFKYEFFCWEINVSSFYRLLFTKIPPVAKNTFFQLISYVST